MAASNNPPLLEVKNLRVEFPTRRGTLLAVDDVSFEISPGEVLGVVGESGAGKSLTGNAIIGLLEPPGRIAAGEIRLAGRRIDNLPYERMRKVRGGLVIGSTSARRARSSPGSPTATPSRWPPSCCPSVRSATGSAGGRSS